MSNTNQELKLKLSLLLDNELSPAEHSEVLDCVVDDPALQTAWARYNLIGEVIRAEKGVFAGDDFVSRIHQTVAQEPSPVVVLSARPVQSSLKQARKPHFFSSGIGLALAASLIGFAIVMGYSVTNPDMSRVDLALQQKDTTVDVSQEALADARFNEYLMTHNEASYLVGSTSMLPHARLVSSPGR
jgi:negative regulator of sigma E activity